VDVDEMVREFRNEALPLIRSLETEVERVLLFVGFINEWLRKTGLGEVKIVRGFAVEFYTGAALRTVDVDLVITGGSGAEKAVREFLERICGSRIGRIYPAMKIISKAIDIVPESGENRRFVEVSTGKYTVKILSPEDTLVYVLSAWKWWGSGEDEVRARVLAEVLKGRLDTRYLCRRAEESGVADKLAEVGIECGG
jgi:hypothetical protein